MFDFGITARQKELRAEVRSFVEKEIIPVAEEYDRQAESPLHIYQKFFEAGWMTRWLPGEDGILPADLTDRCIMAEELAYGCAGIAGAIIVCVFANREIARHGTPQVRAEQKQRFADKRFIACFSATERDAGSDLLAIQTKARRTDRGYRLDGTKAFCSNVSHASHVIVMARTGEDERQWASSFSWFLVPTDAPGVTIGTRWDTLGLRSVSVSPIQLEGVEIPECYRLGEEGKGFSLISESFNQSRTLIAAMAVGIARRARDQVLQYGRRRKLYGNHLYKLQDYRFQIVDMEKDIAAARALVWLSSMKNDQGLDNSKENGIAKLFAGQMVMRVTSAASLMLGGVGYTRAQLVEKLFRDARYIAIVEGPEPVQKELVFAQMLRRNLY